MNKFDEEYNRIVKNVLTYGTWSHNERTGLKTLFYHGDMMKFDLSDGTFPLLTTKKIVVKPMIAELLGFIRGYDNAEQFRQLGCNFWNANANESKDWLVNPNRKGVDDLGRIYGVQARGWVASRMDHDDDDRFIGWKYVDQLGEVVDKLSKGIDDRRLVVTHWNPGERDQQALVPCHMMYMFGIRDGHLDLSMIQRSGDLMLGIPHNIASYSLLLCIVSQITGLKPGIFTHFMHNIHIYENHLEGADEQLKRASFDPPKLLINPNIKSLHDLETWVSSNDFTFENYGHHPFIKFPFAS